MSDIKTDSKIEHGDVRSDYRLKEELGTGAYGIVRRGVSKKTGEEVAVKIITKSKSVTNYRQQQQLETEISILTRAQHPNIISLRRVYQTTSRMFIVMPLVKGGELFDQLMKKGSFAEKDAAFITKQILKGIEYLHSIDIVHRDLKPQNILCDVDSEQNIKSVYITDFGLSKIVPQNPVMNSLVGTPHYIAPETITGGGYTKAVDLWAVGCIVYNLLSSMYPFSGDSPSEIFSNVSSCKIDYSDECFSAISHEAKDLITGLLSHWKTRLTVEEALNHPWLKKNLPSTNIIRTDRLHSLKDAIQPLILRPAQTEPYDQLYLLDDTYHTHWDEDDWLEFLAISKLNTVQKGQFIQQEGENTTKYGIIKEGTVKIQRILSDEHRISLATLGPKDALGTFGLAQYLRRSLNSSTNDNNNPNPALRGSQTNLLSVNPSGSLYSTAETDVQLYVVSYDKLLDLVYSSPSLCLKFWRRLAAEFCRWYWEFCSRAKDEDRRKQENGTPAPAQVLTGRKKKKKRSGITAPNSDVMWHGERVLTKLKTKWAMRGTSAPALLDHVAGSSGSSVLVTKRSLVLRASVFTLKFEARIPFDCIHDLKISAEDSQTTPANASQGSPVVPPNHNTTSINSSSSTITVPNILPTHNASGIPMLGMTSSLSVFRNSNPALSALLNSSGSFTQTETSSAPQLSQSAMVVGATPNASFKIMKVYYNIKKDKTESAKVFFKDISDEKELAAMDLIQSLWMERRQVASKLGECPNVTAGFTNTGALTEDDWRVMLSSTELRFYKKDEVIIAEGQANQPQLFFVQNGRCRVEQAQVDQEDRVAVIGMVLPREIFGEISFLCRNRTPTASVVAQDDSVCLSLISGVHIQNLMREVPGFAPRFYHYICQIISVRLCLTLCNI